MKRSLIAAALVGASLLGLSVARATPQEGTRELRIGNGISIFPSYGTGFTRLSPDEGKNQTSVSFQAGMGYFTSPNVAVGGTFGFYYAGSGSSSYKGPGFSGFLRLYTRTGNVGVFLEPTLEFQYLSLSGSSGSSGVSIKALGPGADLGAEFFLAESWAFRVSPTFRYYKVWASVDGGGSDDTSFTKLGLMLGISAYF